MVSFGAVPRVTRITDVQTITLSLTAPTPGSSAPRGEAISVLATDDGSRAFSGPELQEADILQPAISARDERDLRLELLLSADFYALVGKLTVQMALNALRHKKYKTSEA